MSSIPWSSPDFRFVVTHFAPLSLTSKSYDFLFWPSALPLNHRPTVLSGRTGQSHAADLKNWLYDTRARAGWCAKEWQKHGESVVSSALWMESSDDYRWSRTMSQGPSLKATSDDRTKPWCWIRALSWHVRVWETRDWACHSLSVLFTQKSISISVVLSCFRRGIITISHWVMLFSAYIAKTLLNFHPQHHSPNICELQTKRRRRIYFIRTLTYDGRVDILSWWNQLQPTRVFVWSPTSNHQTITNFIRTSLIHKGAYGWQS